MAQFFINRPVFAWVIAIMIMLAGAFSVVTLPLEMYPEIAPPRVTINTTYTGASAETVENSVTQVIEQQLKPPCAGGQAPAAPPPCRGG